MISKRKIRKRLTLKDVANVLSVTPATISKALRDSSDISFETKEQVKKLCNELGYRPNLLARSLINNRSRILGVLVPDLRISFFSEAVRGMYEEAEKKGYECLLLVHDEDKNMERKKIEFLSDIHADGILLNAVAGKGNYDHYKKLIDEGIRVVCWDRSLEGSNFRSVKIDDIAASYKLTSTIIDQGRKNILFLGPHTGLGLARDRFKGYKLALENNGIKCRPELVVQSFRSVEDSYKKMMFILDNNIEIDGMVSIGGLITYGAGQAILDKKYSIPKDIIIGEFGDNDIVYRLGVPFYSVFQNPYEIGKASTDLLIQMINSEKEDEEYENIIIDFKVIERKTSET
jgi:DNA-binding LacI/PurR family transcriptional regulator